MSLEPMNPGKGSSDEELVLMSLAFAPRMGDADVRSLLRYLNTLTPHRFTGIYRFEPGWVVSVALWDRLNPHIEVGQDVKMKESYCWLTGLGDRHYVIEDALTDARLAGHAAQAEVRSYVAVLLRDRSGRPWGTLCHFDLAPQTPLPGTVDRLEHYRPLIEELLVRDRSATWEPDAPSLHAN